MERPLSLVNELLSSSPQDKGAGASLGASLEQVVSERKSVRPSCPSISKTYHLTQYA